MKNLKQLVLLAACLSLPVLAAAQFKCVDTAGKTSFQQMPCVGAAKQDVLKINAAPPSATVAPQAVARAQTVEQRMLAGLERERRVETLQQALAQAEAGVVNRNAQMANEMDLIRAQKSRARNNLAGAMWEQSLSTEMQAVASKYKAINDAKFERIKVLRAQLDATQVAAK